MDTHRASPYNWWMRHLSVTAIVFSLLFTFFLSTRPSECQSVPQLIDGAAIRVVGTVKVERRGNRSFLMVKPSLPYIAVFDEQSSRQMVHEIGLSLSGQNSTLKKFVGRDVTVTGVLQLEAASPYYFNGTLIIASSVQLPDGSVLLSQKDVSEQKTTISLTSYHALVTYSPREGQFAYRVWDSEGHPLSSTKGYLSCGLNGGGDVMNCFCADGFKPTGLGGMAGDRFILLEKPTMNFAQFLISENLREPVSKAVECTRKP